jgi:hypothetical protein
MPLKPLPRAKDFRYLNLALEVPPILAFAAGIAVGFLWWRSWGIPVGMAIFYGGLRLTGHLTNWRYKIAARSLGTPQGRAGIDYLLYQAEPPESAHKTKIVCDDEGFIFAEDGALRLRSVYSDLRVPFHAFHFQPMNKSKLVPGVLLKFVPEGSSEEIRLAVTFGLVSQEVDPAADPKALRDHTIVLLARMIQRGGAGDASEAPFAVPSASF